MHKPWLNKNLQVPFYLILLVPNKKGGEKKKEFSSYYRWEKKIHPHQAWAAFYKSKVHPKSMKLQHSNKLLLRKVLKLGRCRNLATWPSVIWAIRWTIYPSFPMSVFFLINLINLLIYLFQFSDVASLVSIPRGI